MRLVLALAPFLLSAQTTVDDCRDDNGRDRCATDEQAKARALFGLEPIEAYTARGDELRRVLYVDGYGRDLIAISAIRPRGKAPILRIDFPNDDRRIGGPLVAPLPIASWREIADRSAMLRSAPPASAAGRGADQPICLHSWVYTVETTGPGARRIVEDACRRGPAQTFAGWLSRTAVPLFPHCAALDEKRHRNSAALLRGCGVLSGAHRVAAAHAMNGADAFRGIGGERDAARLAPHFAAAAEVEWAGDRASADDAGRFWAERMGPGDGSVAHLYIDSIEGLTSDRARVRGTLARSVDTPRGRATGSEGAVVEQLWVRQPDGVFRIARATVGSWRPRT